MRNIYFTDGSPEGFFTAVFDAYTDKDAFLSSSPALQSAIGDTFLRVSSCAEKSARVIKKLRAVDKNSLYETDCILRVPDADKEQAAFEYIRLLVKNRKPVRGMLTFKEVRRAMDLVDRVGAERHLLSGFLRFQETADGIFYAPCAPGQRRCGSTHAPFRRKIQDRLLRHPRREKKNCRHLQRQRMVGFSRRGSGNRPFGKRRSFFGTLEKILSHRLYSRAPKTLDR